MADEPHILAAIDQFLVDHGMSPITFGRKAMADPHFVADLRGERGRPRRMWPETEAKVRRFMATYRPTDTKEAA